LFLEGIEIGEDLRRKFVFALIWTENRLECFRAADSVTRSKFPRPEIFAVTVIGSPTCTLFGFASAVIVKLPTAPPKVGGALGGNAFTSMLTGSVVSLI
jgi:hypothetical protein